MKWGHVLILLIKSHQWLFCVFFAQKRDNYTTIEKIIFPADQNLLLWPFFPPALSNSWPLAAKVQIFWQELWQRLPYSTGPSSRKLIIFWASLSPQQWIHASSSVISSNIDSQHLFVQFELQINDYGWAMEPGIKLAYHFCCLLPNVVIKATSCLASWGFDQLRCCTRESTSHGAYFVTSK